MTVELKKFGATLISRPAGKEAWAALRSSLADLKPDENVEVDFDGVITFSPSWGDEFLTPLLKRLGERLIVLSTDNPSVKATIALLERTGNKKFTRQARHFS